MIIEYANGQNVTVEEQIRTLKESVQRAIDSANANISKMAEAGSTDSGLTGRISELEEVVEGKQNKLTAGANIVIVNDVISATGGGSGSGGGDMYQAVYDTNGNGIVDNAEKVNNHTVLKDVPANAKFTDTVFSGSYNDLTDVPDAVTETTVSGWGFIKNGSSAVGSLSKGVWINANHQVLPMLYTLNADVPAGAKFTDTVITESDVSGWGFTKNTGTYSKPDGGIPKSDLDSDVQTSLGKADTALQEHQDISGKQDKLTPGNNISIVNNVISATGGSGGGVSLLDVYPVGAIYISVSSTNPSTLFGGTWEQIQDKFLLSAGDTYSAGSTGGSAEVTLTEAQMPAHTHTPKPTTVNNVASSFLVGNSNISRGGVGSSGSYAFKGAQANMAAPSTSTTTASAGSGEAHDNMPPYLAVYVWKRTA